MKRDGFVGLGAVLTAGGASLCCLLPAAIAFLGVGSAAMGAGLERFRTFFLVLTGIFLAYAFYRAYRPSREECAPGESCAVPASLRRLQAWILAVVSLILVTLPYYINRIL